MASQLDILKKRQQIEKLSNELRTMELEAAMDNLKTEIENQKAAAMQVEERQKKDLAVADKAAADKAAADAKAAEAAKVVAK